jgi:hypothetical protein
MNAITVNSPLKLETSAGDSKDCIKVMHKTSRSKMTMKMSVKLPASGGVQFQ